MYHIEIKNLENDEVIVCQDAVAIIGGIATKEDGVTMAYSEGDTGTLILTCLFAKNAIDVVCENNEDIALTLSLAEKIGINKWCKDKGKETDNWR